jgi:protein-tyrosine phosphatase
MDASNYHNVTDMAKSEAEIAKVKYIMNEVEPDQNQPVPDPWGLTEQHYIEVYRMLDEATDKVIERYGK